MGRWCRWWTAAGARCAPWPSARWRPGGGPGARGAPSCPISRGMREAEPPSSPWPRGRSIAAGWRRRGGSRGSLMGRPGAKQFLDAHRPDAVRILDFPHAAQRLTTVAEGVWGPGGRATAWAARAADQLRDGGSGGGAERDPHPAAGRGVRRRGGCPASRPTSSATWNLASRRCATRPSGRRACRSAVASSRAPTRWWSRPG